MFPLTLRAKFEMFVNALASHGNSSPAYLITEVIILCKLYFYVRDQLYKPLLCIKCQVLYVAPFFFLRPHTLFIFQIFIYLFDCATS